MKAKLQTMKKIISFSRFMKILSQKHLKTVDKTRITEIGQHSLGIEPGFSLFDNDVTLLFLQ